MRWKGDPRRERRRLNGGRGVEIALIGQGTDRSVGPIGLSTRQQQDQRLVKRSGEERDSDKESYFDQTATKPIVEHQPCFDTVDENTAALDVRKLKQVLISNSAKSNLGCRNSRSPITSRAGA